MHLRARHPGGCYPAIREQSGLTLIELMISLTIGLVVVAAATAMLVSVRAGYQMQDDDAQLQATGRYALETIARSVRQAAYENWDAPGNAQSVAGALGAALAGLDARSLRSNTAAIDSPVARSVNGSDVLAVRFFGAGDGGKADGTMTNCAGFGVAAPIPGMAGDGRGWSIFYVAEDATGVPELYCKYQGASGWSSQAIARGVESFQVLYGLDTDADGLPNRFVTAAAIDAMDDALVLDGAGMDALAEDRNRKTWWKKVAAIKVALLVRGAHAIRAERPAAEYDLFGEDYAAAFAATDKGTRIREADLPKPLRGRLRRVFMTTIYLDQRPSGEPA